MKVIIPLAGPDYINEDGSLRAARTADGVPVLKDILESRPWMQRKQKTSFSDVFFVLQDKEIVRRFANDTLLNWFPGSQAIYLPCFTGGAALSALAAISICSEEEPVCVDLADIKFAWQGETPEKLMSSASCAGLIPVFKSTKPYYSYVTLNHENDILAAREKERISEYASCGVYMFKTPSDFIYALNYVLQKPELRYKNLVFVCPLANAFGHTNRKMKAVEVEGVKDFHREIEEVVSTCS